MAYPPLINKRLIDRYGFLSYIDVPEEVEADESFFATLYREAATKRSNSRKFSAEVIPQSAHLMPDYHHSNLPADQEFYSVEFKVPHSLYCPFMV